MSIDLYCATCRTPHAAIELTQLRSMFAPDWEPELSKLGWKFASGNLACIETCPRCPPVVNDAGEASKRLELVRFVASVCDDPMVAVIGLQKARLTGVL